MHTERKSTTNKEFYFHFRNIDHAKVSDMTVFCREEEPGSGVFNFTASLCSPNDQFSRRIGRSVARRRYFNDAASRISFEVTEEDLSNADGNTDNSKLVKVLHGAASEYIAHLDPTKYLSILKEKTEQSKKVKS